MTKKYLVSTIRHGRVDKKQFNLPYTVMIGNNMSLLVLSHKKMLIDKGGFDKVRFVLRLCQKNHTVG